MQNRTSPGSIGHQLVRTDDAAYVAWNLAAVTPWMSVQDPPDPKRKPNALPPVAVIAREGFKAPNKLTDVIAASHRHRMEILELKEAVCTKASFIQERDRFGLAIRRWDSQGGSWRLQVLSALLVEAMDKLDNWLESNVTGGSYYSEFCSVKLMKLKTEATFYKAGKPFWITLPTWMFTRHRR
jgi:hypothetical protein